MTKEYKGYMKMVDTRPMAKVTNTIDLFSAFLYPIGTARIEMTAKGKNDFLEK